MKRNNKDLNNDINSKNKKYKKGKSGINIEENLKNNILVINQQKSFRTKEDELCNVNNIIEDAISNEVTKILLDLESDAFKNYVSTFSEKSLDELLELEIERVDQLIDQFLKDHKEWLHFSVSNKLTPDRKKKMFDKLKNKGWYIEHYVIPPCLDYAADEYWEEGCNDKPEVSSAGVCFPLHTNTHRIKKVNDFKQDQ